MADLPVTGRVTAAWGACASNIWATVADNTNIASILHFDARGWTVVPSPQPQSAFLLTAIGTGADDVWLGGYNFTGVVLFHRHL
jgi:hypothetical protein